MVLQRYYTVVHSNTWGRIMGPVSPELVPGGTQLNSTPLGWSPSSTSQEGGAWSWTSRAQKAGVSMMGVKLTCAPWTIYARTRWCFAQRWISLLVMYLSRATNQRRCRQGRYICLYGLGCTSSRWFVTILTDAFFVVLELMRKCVHLALRRWKWSTKKVEFLPETGRICWWFLFPWVTCKSDGQKQ